MRARCSSGLLHVASHWRAANCADLGTVRSVTMSHEQASDRPSLFRARQAPVCQGAAGGEASEGRVPGTSRPPGRCTAMASKHSVQWQRQCVDSEQTYGRCRSWPAWLCRHTASGLPGAQTSGRVHLHTKGWLHVGPRTRGCDAAARDDKTSSECIPLTDVCARAGCPVGRGDGLAACCPAQQCRDSDKPVIAICRRLV